jgi:class 3 adenylate cyclase
MRQLAARALSIGADPSDDQDLRLRKVLLLTAAYLILPLAVVWGAIYMLAGATGAGLIPWTYAVLSILSIGIFAGVRTYWWFGLSQLALFIVLPFVLMWSLGGFVEGSAVALFASAAPLFALLLGHRRLAPILLVVYVALVIATPALEAYGPFDGLGGDPLPSDLVGTYFVMNLAAVPVLTWLLVLAFSGGREGMLSAARGIVRRYLAPAAADRFLADPRHQELGGEIAEVTVMFADLGGFTRYAETRSPAEVVDLLNRYFSLTLPAILEEGGTPVQLPGDAIMAVFGAPMPHADHAARACRAARRMHRAVEQAAASDTDGAMAPRFRIGINSGEALVGNIGSEDFRNFTAIGDTTIVAQRLQASAEPGQIVIGQATASALASDSQLTPTPPIHVKGRVQPVDSYLLV